jgi:hypothetical protein
MANTRTRNFLLHVFKISLQLIKTFRIIIDIAK